MNSIEKEKSISFPVGIKCPTCKEGYIFEKIKEVVLATHHNGCIGPGSRSWQDTKIDAVYFCENCGQIFEPTDKNQYAKDHTSNKAVAFEKFQKTESFPLTRDLKLSEVFIRKPGGIEPVEDKNLIDFFKKGKEVLVYKSENSYSDSQFFELGFLSLPYIVPVEGGKKITFWQQRVYEWVPLSKKEKADKRAKKKKEEKKLIKAGYTRENTNRFNLLDSQYSGKELNCILKENEPLPKGSVLAMKVYFPDLLGDFFIPAKKFI